MQIFSRLIVIFWLIFFVYWFISAFSAKKNARRNSSGALFRILALIIVILLFRVNIFQQFANYHSSSLLINSIGVVLCALGISFAIWARVHLGSNWGMPMSLKENPELITTGPYKLVRHPIYTGMILALFGSALVDGLLGFIIFIFFTVYFSYSATREEKIMTEKFPDQYPEYKKRTKMLIPFVF